ncbi:DtxR family Mn-dependent transcriptional regulator [Hymenobacter luteus]|uniref:Transcriptional regulator MntR n=2 Tax=Hymenobacter TaxID=89966 RepID=A0A7W9WDA7_9BACT|nr:metal-dependent transcriptional regulator [Hymenobacter latericoloratus]MBB4602089.1 DtxR family Mn-dependent transcriptional regulator [Hymenobacter latericoloratus]MBB6059482.1 DtxR family Mn-dependent transcriptional regulator [Hymenobacter luteus]
MPSYTEENYLKAIYKLAEAAPGTEVSTNSVAEALQTRAASVTDMLRRLGEKGLLHYTRYRGVTLTAEGRRLALLTIRKHRLWEVFLVQQLGFSWDEVHEVAEQMEHIDSDLLIQRLDEFLGYPQLDPHGDPIPTAEGVLYRPQHRLLADLRPGDQGTVVAVKNTSGPFLQYLDKAGLKLGTHIEVLDKIQFDNSLEIRINKTKEYLISAEVSRNLFVTG